MRFFLPFAFLAVAGCGSYSVTKTPDMPPDVTDDYPNAPLLRIENGHGSRDVAPVVSRSQYMRLVVKFIDRDGTVTIPTENKQYSLVAQQSIDIQVLGRQPVPLNIQSKGDWKVWYYDLQ